MKLKCELDVITFECPYVLKFKKFCFLVEAQNFCQRTLSNDLFSKSSMPVKDAANVKDTAAVKVAANVKDTTDENKVESTLLHNTQKQHYKQRKYEWSKLFLEKFQKLYVGATYKTFLTEKFENLKI